MYVRAVCVHGVNVNGKIGILRRGISRKSRGAVNAIYSRLAYSSLEKYLKRVSPLVILARRNGNPLEGVFFFFFGDRVSRQKSLDFFEEEEEEKGSFFLRFNLLKRLSIIKEYNSLLFVMEMFCYGNFLLVGEILLFSCIMEIILMKIKIK